MTDIRVGAAAVKVLRRANSSTQKLLTGQVAVKVLRAYLPEPEPPSGDLEEPISPFIGQIWPRSEELSEDGSWVPATDDIPITALNTAWTTLAAIATGRYANALLAYDGSIWAIGGRTGITTLKDVSVYDPSTNTWLVKPGSWPAVNSGYGAAGVGIISGKFYIAGGASSSAQSSELWEYNPTTNAWTQKTSMPQGRYFSSSAAGFSSIGNKLYVAGGATPNPGSVDTKTLLIYNQSTDTWSSGPDMPGTPGTNGSSTSQITVLDGKLYVACVTAEAPTVTSLFVYDPATDAWSTRTGIPSLVASKFGIVPMLGKLYMIYYDGYWIYDPVTDSWTNQVTTGQSPSNSAWAQSVVYNNEIYRISSSTSGAVTSTTSQKLGRAAQTYGTSWTADPSLPISLTRFGTFTLNKVIYVCGGRTFGGNASRRVFALDTKLENPTWVEKAKMPAARTDVFSGRAQGRGYIVGGKNSGGDEVRTVYRYNPGNNKWYTRALMPSSRSSSGVSSHKCGSGGKIYIAGGERLGEPKRTLYIYDVNKDRWSNGPDMPASVSGNVIVVRGVRGKVYSVSGITGSGASGGLYCYDPSTNKWDTLASPTSTKDVGSFATISGATLALSGVGSTTAAVITYDISSDAWSSGAVPNNPANSKGSAFVNCGRRLYLVGGSGYSNSDPNRSTKQVWSIPAPSEADEDEVFVPSIEGQVWPRRNVIPPIPFHYRDSDIDRYDPTWDDALILWRLDEPAGSTVVHNFGSGGSAYDATLEASPTSQVVFGSPGPIYLPTNPTSMRFDLGDEAISRIRSPFTRDDQSFTVEGWVRPERMSTGTGSYWFNMFSTWRDGAGTGATAVGIRISIYAYSPGSNSGYVSASYQNGQGAINPLSSPGFYVADAWHHIAYVRDASLGMAFLYIDGKLAGSAAATTPVSGQTLAMVGAPKASSAGVGTPGPFRNTKGNVQRVAYWPKALSVDTIRNHIAGWVWYGNPTLRVRPGIAVDEVNRNMYLMGGGGNTSASGVFEKMNLDTGKITAIASATTVTQGFGYIYNGKLYFFGGHSTGAFYSGNLFRYEEATNTWTTLALGPSRGDGAIGDAVLGGRLYAAGGGQGGSGAAQATVDRYNVSTNGWESVPNMPAAILNTSCFVKGGLFYVVGTISPLDATKRQLWAFDPVANSWSTVSLIPVTDSVDAAFVNKTTGLVWFITSSGSVWTWKSSTDTWTLMPKMQMNKVTYSSIAFDSGNRLVAVQGDQGRAVRYDRSDDDLGMEQVEVIDPPNGLLWA